MSIKRTADYRAPGLPPGDTRVARGHGAKHVDRAFAVGLLVGVFLGAAGVAVLVIAADILEHVPA